MVIDRRREQIVGKSDRVEVAGKMQVDVFHWYHLRITSAGGAALHAEHRSQARLAQTNHGFLADLVQRVSEPDGGRRFALAGRRRADRGDEDQLAIFLLGEAVDVRERNLGLVMAVGHELIFGNTELFGDFDDALHLRSLRDFNIR